MNDMPKTDNSNKENNIESGLKGIKIEYCPLKIDFANIKASEAKMREEDAEIFKAIEEAGKQAT